MHPPDTATPKPAGDTSPPRLSGTVEGVEFRIVLAHERHLRCVITESALRVHFGARPDDPGSWLEAFRRHRIDIECHALAAAARRDGVHVVLLRDSSGRLKSVAGHRS